MSHPARDPLAWPAIAVITPGNCTGTRIVERTRLLYAQGMRMLVLREPTLPVFEHRSVLEALVKACPELRLVHHHKCPLTRFLQGQSSVCVHLPAAVALQCFEARHMPPWHQTFRGTGRSDGLGLFGVSVHNEQELSRAMQEGASYAMLAPIWSPNSKPGDVRPTLGPQTYERLLAKSSIPLYALGGVDAQRCSRWREAQNVRVALIGELYQASAERALDAFRALCEIFGPRAAP